MALLGVLLSIGLSGCASAKTLTLKERRKAERQRREEWGKKSAFERGVCRLFGLDKPEPLTDAQQSELQQERATYEANEEQKLEKSGRVGLKPGEAALLEEGQITEITFDPRSSWIICLIGSEMDKEQRPTHIRVLVMCCHYQTVAISRVPLQKDRKYRIVTFGGLPSDSTTLADAKKILELKLAALGLEGLPCLASPEQVYEVGTIALLPGIHMMGQEVTEYENGGKLSRSIIEASVQRVASLSDRKLTPGAGARVELQLPCLSPALPGSLSNPQSTESQGPSYQPSTSSP